MHRIKGCLGSLFLFPDIRFCVFLRQRMAMIRLYIFFFLIFAAPLAMAQDDGLITPSGNSAQPGEGAPQGNLVAVGRRASGELGPRGAQLLAGRAEGNAGAP